jgi:xylan 1,4-beta-xylosidase
METCDGIDANSTHSHCPAQRARSRLVNDRQEIDFYYRRPGQHWKRTQESAELASMNHNVLGGFLSLRPALYACGSGKATFRAFRHVVE